MYKRKTIDLYDVQGYYDSLCGFETVTTEETWKEAKERIKEYRENEPGTSFRVKKYREAIA